MHTVIRKSFVFALAGVFVVAALLLSSGKPRAENSLSRVAAVNCPAVLLKHWQASSQNEKLAFLFGLATMLEMEKEWQGERPVAVGHSLNRLWVNGLDNVTLGQMSAAIDNYIAQHPDQMDVSVIRVLALLYVNPKMSQDERKAAGARYREMKSASQRK